MSSATPHQTTTKSKTLMRASIASVMLPDWEWDDSDASDPELDPPAAAGQPASRRPTPDAIKPTFPVEILDEIFKLAVQPRVEPSSPFKRPISPMKSFVALLLASRTLRALAIPLVYKSITIAKPKDFITFFGINRGVFVVGGDLDAKRAALREICLVEEAAFPLDLGSNVDLSFDPTALFIGGKDASACLFKLDLSGVRVDCLTMLSLPSGKAAEVYALRWNEVKLARLVVHAASDIRVSRKTASKIGLKRGTSPQDVADDVIDATIHRTVLDRLTVAQEEAIVPFLQAIRPQTIRLAPWYSTRLTSHNEFVYHDPVRVVTYLPDGQQKIGRRKFASSHAFVNIELPCAFPGAIAESRRKEEARLKSEKGNNLI